MNIYFPTYPGARLPKRQYLLNIVNTVEENSIIKAVHQIRLERENKIIEQAPILITNEFLSLFQQFQSISNDQKHQRLTLHERFKIQQCPCCLEKIRSKAQSGYFNCKRHVAHRVCVVNYNTSENARRSQFFCPLKCLDINNSH